MVSTMLFICFLMPQTIIEIVFNPYGGPPVTCPGLCEPKSVSVAVAPEEGEVWR